ncbi:MAG: pitrilysin family protein [Acutalibacteraceae bacterium]|nr:pitrilysin family protein [Acutalibacteraceae bacterium]
MSSIVRKSIANGVSFNSIKEERFKTAKISVTMFVPLNKKTAAAYTLLPSVLAYSCKKYPTTISLNRALSNLYGANISSECKKMGESLALTLTVTGIDDRYTMNKEKISPELVKLLCEIIFNPNVENNAFVENNFEQCKRQLLEAIEGEFNEKRTYAISQMLGEMCKDEAYGIKRYGTKEDVEKLTSQELYKVWKDILVNSRIEVMMIGSSDTSLAEKIIEDNFSSFERTQPEIKTEVKTTVENIKEKTESSDIAQAKLVMGFRTATAQPENDSTAMSLTVAILGGTPSSKFFVNVREKLSLCYYCAARYYKLKGIVIVDSGVEKKNINRTIEEIKNQLDEMKKGNITDFEIESAKLSLINSYKSVQDTVAGTESWYINQMLDNEILTVEQAVEKLNAVDKDTIVELANTITLDTVYLLQPKDSKEEQ